jgi:hypothetical protein
MRFHRRGAAALRSGETPVAISYFDLVTTGGSLACTGKCWVDDARQQDDRQRNGISNVEANREIISTITSTRDEAILA